MWCPMLQAARARAARAAPGQGEQRQQAAGAGSRPCCWEEAVGLMPLCRTAHVMVALSQIWHTELHAVPRAVSQPL